MLLVAAGGSIGALLRYGIGLTATARLPPGFPYGTLLANVLGSLAAGVAFVVIFERIPDPTPWRAFFLIGLLGALTTYSTFSLETVGLFLSGQALKALLNAALNVGVCLLACWLGIALTRAI